MVWKHLLVVTQDVTAHHKNFSACSYEFLDASMIVLAGIRVVYAS